MCIRDRYFGASPHVAIESRAVAADGTLGEPVALVAFPDEPVSYTHLTLPTSDLV